MVIVKIIISHAEVDGQIIDIALNIRFLLNLLPLLWVGKVGGCHPIQELTVLVQLHGGPGLLVHHPILNQRPVAHLIILAEILIVIPLQHEAVIPVFSVQVHPDRNAPLDRNRPIRHQLRQHGIRQCFFDHHRMGGDPFKKNRIKNLTAAVFFPGSQGEALFGRTPGRSALDFQARFLIQDIPAAVQQFRRDAHFPILLIVGNRSRVLLSPGQIPVIIVLSRNVDSLVSEQVLIRKHQRKGVPGFRRLQADEIGLG